MKKIITIAIVLLLAVSASAVEKTGMMYAPEGVSGSTVGGTANEVEITDNGDGSVTVGLTDSVILNTPTLAGTLDADDNPITNLGYVDFDQANGISQATGRMVWNPTDGTLNLGLSGGVVNLQMGQEMVVLGKNVSGGSLANGTAVRITGASGNRAEFNLSDADSLTANSFAGLTTEIIGNNNNGFVTMFGLVRELDTSGTPVSETWNDADDLYVSTTAGKLTNIMPTGIEQEIFVGTVVRAHATEGIILVHPAKPKSNSGPQAEMWAEEITIALGAGVWANVTGLTNGVVSTDWMTQNSTNGSVTVTKGQIYKFVGSVSFEDNDGPSEQYHLVPAIDGTPIEKCEQHESISTQAALSAVPVTCLLDLSDGDVVTLLANSVGGDDITLEHVNWMIFR